MLTGLDGAPRDVLAAIVFERGVPRTTSVTIGCPSTERTSFLGGAASRAASA